MSMLRSKMGKEDEAMSLASGARRAVRAKALAN
jgi:hypothetical protein